MCVPAELGDRPEVRVSSSTFRSVRFLRLLLCGPSLVVGDCSPYAVYLPSAKRGNHSTVSPIVPCYTCLAYAVRTAIRIRPLIPSLK
jgi:hypothetical protein